MDSSVSETHGAQEGTAYDGHFACMCYHPLFVFNQFGDLERCSLRPGNVHSADGWRDVLGPVVEGYKYTIRLPVNPVLQQSIAWLLTRPIGRPLHEDAGTTPASATKPAPGPSCAVW
jgi:Transposase DDE domain group 1